WLPSTRSEQTSTLDQSLRDYIAVLNSRARSAGQQFLGHPSSVARPLRPVNLGPRDGAVEQHHKSASRRFRVLYSRRRRPLAETLREPRPLTVGNGARRVRRIG